MESFPGIDESSEHILVYKKAIMDLNNTRICSDLTGELNDADGE